MTLWAKAAKDFRRTFPIVPHLEMPPCEELLRCDEARSHEDVSCHYSPMRVAGQCFSIVTRREKSNPIIIACDRNQYIYLKHQTSPHTGILISQWIPNQTLG